MYKRQLEEYRRMESEDLDGFIKRERYVSSITERYVYSEKEIEQADLLIWHCHTVRRHDDLIGYGYGGPPSAEFDFSTGCVCCKIGAEQKSPLRLKRRIIPKEEKGVFRTPYYDVMISRHLYDAFRKAEVTGARFIEAVSYEDGTPLGWYQIIPVYELPRFDERTQGFEVDPAFQCPVCQKDSYYNGTYEANLYVYSRKEVDPDDLPDICCSWERLGASSLKNYLEKERKYWILPAPFLYVKPRVMKIIRKLQKERKVAKTSFEPVHFWD